MKKRILFFSISALALGLVTALSAHFAQAEPLETTASQTATYPGNGRSGTAFFVSGKGSFFKSGEADLAIYCYNNTEGAWSDRASYSPDGSLVRIMIPYKDGQAKTWSRFFIARYNPNKTPAYDGDSGIYNRSDDISFADAFPRGQNTIYVTGYSDNKLTINEMKGTTPYYGIKGDEHMYLDLSGFPQWEESGAKFAIWFAYPHYLNKSRWGMGNSKDNGYQPSFCWKVEGQDNDHLYECIVPNVSSNEGKSIWSMAIAVRFNPDATSPNWDYAWNQTQDLSFVVANNNADMIHVSDWNDGDLDADNVIGMANRLEFYGNYFLDTVVCSGAGDSDATTATMWNAVKDEYEQHLSLTYQGEIWKLDPAGKGTRIAQAMERYDYIVFTKAYSHVDFINRAESPYKISSVGQVNAFMTNNVALSSVIVTIALLSSGAVIGLLLYRNAKRKRQ